MPRGMHRSNTLKKVFVKVPGNRTVVHRKKGQNKKAKCSECGAILPGVPNKSPKEMQKMARTEKRPERPYGGVLCSKCMRKSMKEKAKLFKVE